MLRSPPTGGVTKGVTKTEGDPDGTEPDRHVRGTPVGEPERRHLRSRLGVRPRDALRPATDAQGVRRERTRGRLALVGCGSSTDGSAASSSGTASDGAVAGDDCATIPEETEGPYPADGSNGPDVLSQSGIVRKDIRSSFGELSGIAEGVPLTIRLTIENTSDGCAPLAGGAVYLWHCSREGNYSLYTVTDQNYLRGVQEADGDGVVTFTSIFPGC